MEEKVSVSRVMRETAEPLKRRFEPVRKFSKIFLYLEQLFLVSYEMGKSKKSFLREMDGP